MTFLSIKACVVGSDVRWTPVGLPTVKTLESASPRVMLLKVTAMMLKRQRAMLLSNADVGNDQAIHCAATSPDLQWPP